jgi:Cysteine rich repeat
MVPLYRLPRYRLARCIGAREVAALALLAFPIAMADPTAAQPSPGQIATLRQACRSDFIAHCSGVQPGGREALQCLERNAARLSTECGSAVSAVLPKAATRPETRPETPTAETNPEAPPPEMPQPAAAAGQPSQQDQLTAVQEACTLKDFMSHCSWIAPGNPELLLCLRANAAGLSPACQNVVRATPAAATPSAVAAPPMTAQPITAPPLPAPPAAAVAAPRPAPAASRAATVPQRPSAKQLSTIRAACRSDFIAHCSGMQPGGRDALLCLERNQAEISQSCQSALAAIGGGTPSLGAASPGAASPGVASPGAASADPANPEAATPPAETEPLLIPRLPLRAEIAILRVCAASHRSLCGDVPPGGGRIIACLARNAPRLLPECRAALAAVRG